MSNTEDNWFLERYIVGDLMVNCYLVAWKPTNEAVIIDPGGESELVFEKVREHGYKITAVINTHGHGDHIGGNGEMVALTGAPLIIGRRDAEMLTDADKNMSAPFGMATLSIPADKVVSEGDVIKVGDGKLKIFEAPGHSAGSIILAGDGFAIVGDVLFNGSIGRTDFPGGSFEELIRSIQEKIMPLGDDCIVLPGHGPETTVGHERRTNPFLQPGMSFDF